MARSGGSGAIPRRAATHKRRARSRSSTPERHPCDNLRHGDGRVYSGRDGQGGRRKGKSKGPKGSPKGKGKGKAKDKHARHDSTRPPPEAVGKELEKLSDETKAFHQSICDQVPAEDIVNGTWKYVVWNNVEMTDDMMEWFFTHLRELGMTKKKRIYIGPGRDGSSDNKI